MTTSKKRCPDCGVDDVREADGRHDPSVCIGHLKRQRDRALTQQADIWQDLRKAHERSAASNLFAKSTAHDPELLLASLRVAVGALEVATDYLDRPCVGGCGGLIWIASPEIDRAGREIREIRRLCVCNGSSSLPSDRSWAPITSDVVDRLRGSISVDYPELRVIVRLLEEAVSHRSAAPPVSNAGKEVWGYSIDGTHEGGFLGTCETREEAIREAIEKRRLSPDRLFLAPEIHIQRGRYPIHDGIWDTDYLAEIAEENLCDQVASDDEVLRIHIAAPTLQQVVIEWANRWVSFDLWIPAGEPERIPVPPESP